MRPEANPPSPDSLGSLSTLPRKILRVRRKQASSLSAESKEAARTLKGNAPEGQHRVYVGMLQVHVEYSCCDGTEGDHQVQELSCAAE